MFSQFFLKKQICLSPFLFLSLSLSLSLSLYLSIYLYLYFCFSLSLFLSSLQLSFSLPFLILYIALSWKRVRSVASYRTPSLQPQHRTTCENYTALCKQSLLNKYVCAYNILTDVVEVWRERQKEREIEKKRDRDRERERERERKREMEGIEKVRQRERERGRENQRQRQIERERERERESSIVQMPYSHRKIQLVASRLFSRYHQLFVDRQKKTRGRLDQQRGGK